MVMCNPLKANLKKKAFRKRKQKKETRKMKKARDGIDPRIYWGIGSNEGRKDALELDGVFCIGISSLICLFVPFGCCKVQGGRGGWFPRFLVVNQTPGGGGKPGEGSWWGGRV